jgi:MFS family permease
VPVQGHFWSALAGPFFIAGAGTAFGFVPISIAGLAGVAGREAGLASGLLNTSQQLGGAIGVAIASTVAATHFTTLIGEGKAPSAALTGGFHWALWACGTIALLALPATATLRRKTGPADMGRAVPAPGDDAVPALEGDVVR